MRFGRLDQLLTHTSVSTKSTDCYLGLLYAMEDVAVYGYVTPLRMKIVLALALSDTVIRDVDIISVSWHCNSANSSLCNDIHRYSRHCTWRITLRYPTLS